MRKLYWVAFKTICNKEINRFSRIWIQTLVPPVITASLYFTIFGSLIGPKIGSINGLSYMQFIVPGLIMMTVMTNSYSNVSSSFFSAKFAHSIEELLVAPVPSHIMILGYVCGGIVRGFCVGVLVTLVSMFFIPIHIHSLTLMLSTIFLTKIVFSLAGMLNAIYAKNFDDISLIPTFILTPLTYLGGIFYSLRSLPKFWQTISTFNPVVYMISGFRYGFLGLYDIPIWITISVQLSLVFVFYFLIWRLIERGHGLRN